MYRISQAFVWSILISLFTLSSPKLVRAVTIELLDVPTTINNSMFQFNVNVQGANDGTNYLRVDLYKDGTSNYFGETYNGLDWYSGSNGKSYLPIQIQNSTSSAQLQAQIGNPSSGDYPGPGLYKLKIRRYTSSGSQSSNDTQTPIDIQITYQTPSPEPIQTATPQVTSVPTQTATPTPKPTPTKSPTPKPTVSPTPTEESEETNELPNLISNTPEGLVAGATDNKKPPITAIIFILLGVSCLGYVGYMIYNMNHQNGQKHAQE